MDPSSGHLVTGEGNWPTTRATSCKKRTDTEIVVPGPPRARRGLFFPGNLADLEKAVVVRVKNRAGEQQAERDPAVFECVKILGGGHVEIKRAGNRQIDERRADEWSDDGAGMSPKRAPERLSPPRWLAKQIE